MTPQATQSNLRRLISKEVAILVGFLFAGLIVLPYLIYIVGDGVFGTYAGSGYWSFFTTLSGKIRSGDLVAWFLVLSPYMGWQCLRLAVKAWQLSGRSEQVS